MDKKAMEYMKARVDKYKKIESERSQLLSDKSSIAKDKAHRIEGSQWEYYIPATARQLINESIVIGMDKRLIEIDQEIENI